jgi:hypothetical protein
MCDTAIVCELFNRFAEKVKAHLELQDRSIYGRLLTDPDKRTNTVAVRSLNGAKEMKRIFAAYTNTWCRNGLDVCDHERFVKETEDIFRLVMERIGDEVENLYPAARREERANRVHTA